MANTFDPNYYTDQHYMYGNTFIQPPIIYGQYNVPYGPNQPFCPIGNNCCNTVQQPAPSIEQNQSYYLNPPVIPMTPQCNCNIANEEVPNILNITSNLLISLKITLYGVSENETIILENNKKYKITYLTEQGVVKATGVLKYIEPTIPMDCVKYIGNNTDVANQAYIIIDASTNLGSNIIRIFIKSIRAIEEMELADPSGVVLPQDATQTYINNAINQLQQNIDANTNLIQQYMDQDIQASNISITEL